MWEAGPPEDELGRFRLIQAEQRFHDAYVWLEDFEAATWMEVRRFIGSYCPPGPSFDAFLLASRGWQSEGFKPHECKDRKTGQTFEDELRSAMAEFRRGLDPLSLIGSVIAPRDEGKSVAFYTISDEGWLAPFDGDGGFVTITGPPRMGKTGIAGHIVLRWLRNRRESPVFSNIVLTKPVERYVEVESMKALMGNIVGAIEERKKWLWVFDDAGLEWLKQRTSKGTALDLDQFARIVPKHGGSLVYIDQREAGIPSTLSDFTFDRIRAVRPGFAILRMKDLPSTVRDIPLPPGFPYISNARSTFLMDMDMEGIKKALPRPEAAKA